MQRVQYQDSSVCVQSVPLISLHSPMTSMQLCFLENNTDIVWMDARLTLLIGIQEHVATSSNPDISPVYVAGAVRDVRYSSS